MEAKSILYVRLTKTEIKSINLENKSEGGSSQTYIDIPKGQVSDDAMNSFSVHLPMAYGILMCTV